MNYKFEMSENEGCPCMDISWKEFKFHSHCWKTGLCCEYSGVHIESYPRGQFNKAKEIAKILANQISRDWTTEVKVNTKPYGKHA